MHSTKWIECALLILAGVFFFWVLWKNSASKGEPKSSAANGPFPTNVARTPPDGCISFHSARTVPSPVVTGVSRGQTGQTDACGIELVAAKRAEPLKYRLSNMALSYEEFLRSDRIVVVENALIGTGAGTEEIVGIPPICALPGIRTVALCSLGGR